MGDAYIDDAILMMILMMLMMMILMMKMMKKTCDVYNENTDDYNDHNKVEGCASQVWLVVEEIDKQGKTLLKFTGDSDAFIVKGLIAIIFALFSEKTPSEILEIDPMSELKKLNLEENISQQRSNGLTAMINRVFSEAKKRI